MTWIAILGLLLLVVAATWWWRRAPARNASSPRATEAAPFGSVEIRVRSGACETAKALSGQRFLALEAPALPLPACSAARCTCSFVKLTDRRTESRRLGYGLNASMFLSADRREQHERRDED
jgi:hypothetical protein